MTKGSGWAPRGATCLTLIIGLAACDSTGGFSGSGDDVFAPGVDVRAEARSGVDPAEVGHRLIAAGEYELAIKAFNRAALDRGALDTEILSGLGTANLGLGRLGTAEDLLRQAAEREDAAPVDFNNLGVLLMEKGQTSEAVQIFKRAFALSNGESVEIRDNLRLALAKMENSATLPAKQDSEYKLVRRGSTQFTIEATPR
jgi:Flp pilus assembly protein TadD